MSKASQRFSKSRDGVLRCDIGALARCDRRTLALYKRIAEHEERTLEQFFSDCFRDGLEAAAQGYEESCASDSQEAS